MPKMSRTAGACVSREIARHCRRKKGRCRGAGRAQAVAIGYSICRRRGYRSIPRRP